MRAVNQRAEFYERKMEEMNKKLTVFTRHHENARRLLGSAAYLLYIGEEWRSEMLNNILSECLTCLEKDHSDKSVALFKVYGKELRIEHYIRLSARSARSVRLKKGRASPARYGKRVRRSTFRIFRTSKSAETARPINYG